MKCSSVLPVILGLLLQLISNSCAGQKVEVRAEIIDQQGNITESQLIVRDTSQLFIAGAIADQGRISFERGT